MRHNTLNIKDNWKYWEKKINWCDVIFPDDSTYVYVYLWQFHIDGLVQDCSNSSALALELQIFVCGLYYLMNLL